ncbi:MAG: DUF885 domain-containing protein [Alphaproteobacteria bacterium]|nr:DUF885 domain-containing protein [Alphaproteobacteria bacterium]
MRSRGVAALTAVAVFGVTSAGCRAHTSPPSARPAARGPAALPGDEALRQEATAGIADPVLADLLADHWRWRLSSSPETATFLGVRGFDDAVSDPSLAALAVDQAREQAFLERVRAIDPAGLSTSDALFRGQLELELAGDVAAQVCRFGAWSVSVRSNPMDGLFELIAVQPLQTEADAEALLTRIGAWADVEPHRLDALRAGLADGLVANATSIQLVLTMLRDQLAADDAAWPIVREAPDDAAWGPSFRSRLLTIVHDRVRPAFQAYADLLETELLPAARSEGPPGLAGLPNGRACYAAQIERFTTLPLTAAALHQTGLDELARIHAAFLQLAPATIGQTTLPGIFTHLRTDPALRFDSADAIVATATAALARAQAAVPDWFGVVPEAPCGVEVIPAYAAPYTTIAYYRPLSADGSIPGAYFVNTYAPETRPTFEAEVLAFHESVPGHHLQIARSYELSAVPAFHRYGGHTAFVEGWGLYAEGLADEMGLYSGDLDRLGALSFDAWRAARLVVDTGVHDLGWTREEAVQFMLDNTPLAENNIRNEVDRYIVWPGQALAYKTGQLHIRALRAQAEAALGDRFDVRSFHDVVLGAGAVSLPALTARVQAWIEQSRQADAP